MNRVGLKDYLLNHADDNDLLDCAKAWDAANRYGRFADEIVGVGESLDDMCENRREVASMGQDVDAEDRGLEDKNHDNSEIGE